MLDHFVKNWLKVCFPARIGHCVFVCGKRDHVRSKERCMRHCVLKQVITPFSYCTSTSRRPVSSPVGLRDRRTRNISSLALRDALLVGRLECLCAKLLAVFST